jgi:hypothetical protein
MKHLIALLLLVPLLIAGCSAWPATRGVKLAIIYFNAEPSTISPGGISTLSWSVTGANTITIDHGIGSVALSGTRAVSPAAGTVYTLFASTATGSVMATTQVIVTGAATTTSTPTPAPAPTPSSPGLPDLVITDISDVGGTIYYTIENQGNEYAGPSYSTLLVDGATVANDSVVGYLIPGQSRTESFAGYAYSCTGPGDNLVVKADTGNAIIESSEANNSFTKSWPCSTSTVLPVIPAFVLQPDLTVEDIWLVHGIDGDQIYYRVKNNGSMVSADSSSFLYIYPCPTTPCQVMATDAVAPLGAGESRTEKFASYIYIHSGSGVTVKVDATNAVNESDEDNNSLTKTGL